MKLLDGVITSESRRSMRHRRRLRQRLCLAVLPVLLRLLALPDRRFSSGVLAGSLLVWQHFHVPPPAASKASGRESSTAAQPLAQKPPRPTAIF